MLRTFNGKCNFSFRLLSISDAMLLAFAEVDLDLFETEKKLTLGYKTNNLLYEPNLYVY